MYFCMSFHGIENFRLFFLLGSCRNWRRKKERRKRSDWRSRGKGERGTKSESARGNAATARKRRKGRGKRSGKETETVNGREIANGRGRRSERESARERGVETSVKDAVNQGQWRTMMSHLSHSPQHTHLNTTRLNTLAYTHTFLQQSTEQ